MQKQFLFVIGAFYFSASTTLYANMANQHKAPIVVTATRTAQTTDESLAAVTVITREDIERQQARSMQGLLRGVTGISIANSGGPGKQTSLFMRGTASDQVLVLIDGVRSGLVSSGGAAYENIPIEQIERIEIVRGPRSSLYGSEAIGGVIQIFTRKGSKAQGFRPSFSFGGGSYGSVNGSVGLSGRNQRGWLNMNISGQGTSGINACSGSSSAGCFATINPPVSPDSDRDGYENVAGSMRAGYRFDNGLEVTGNFLRTEGKSEFDEGDDFPGFVSPNRAKLMQQVFGGKVSYSPTKMWKFSFMGGRSFDNATSKFNKVFVSRFDSRRDTVTVQNDLTLSKDHLLTIGADYKHDHLSSSTEFAKSSRVNWGAFAQHQAKVYNHDVQLSIRYDDNEQFGGHVTGGVAWGYSFSELFRLKAGFGTAFRSPTFNDLYFPNFGNADLKPEKSLSYEFGASGRTSWTNWSVNFFETYIDDLIEGRPDGNTFFFKAFNVEKARIRGFEGEFKTQIKSVYINANLTLLEPKNRSRNNLGSPSSNRGNVLPRRAEQSFRIDANKQFDRFTLGGIPFGKFSLGAVLLVEGERYDNAANTRKLDSYVKFDLRGEYQFNEHLRLQGRIENLFNERYETVAFFNQPGRNFFITVRYQP